MVIHSIASYPIIIIIYNNKTSTKSYKIHTINTWWTWLLTLSKLNNFYLLHSVSPFFSLNDICHSWRRVFFFSKKIHIMIIGYEWMNKNQMSWILLTIISIIIIIIIRSLENQEFEQNKIPIITHTHKGTQ